MTRILAALLFCAACIGIAPARAADAIIAGAVGSASASHWPMLIALRRGMFAARGITVDLVSAPSNAAAVQQLTAGSLDVSYSAGLVDPMRAVAQGASVALVRIESQASPYTLLANPKFPKMADLKGRIISVGGAKDITRIYLERMLAANGVPPGGYDLVYAGATSARMAALMSGAADAALLAPPFSFKAQSAGYLALGNAVDSARDLPFSGTAVNRAWAEAHRALLARFLAAYTEAIAWFYQDANRGEAVQILVDASHADRAETDAGYLLFRQLDLFDKTGTLTPGRLQPVVAALQSIGDLPAGFDAAKLLLPGGTP